MAPLVELADVWLAAVGDVVVDFAVIQTLCHEVAHPEWCGGVAGANVLAIATAVDVSSEILVEACPGKY